MNYQEAMTYMKQVNTYGSVLGLENMRELLKRLSNPEKDLKIVHIAGTNGKGSTLAFISNILRCAEYQVGAYISPTLFSYEERIQINGRPIAKKTLAALLTTIQAAVLEMTAQGFAHPTAFEVETALAFLYFKQKKCDIVILETGLGGSLDATNIIDKPLLAVITPISMDHMSFLGNTLSEIAKQKAGIIKQGCPVVSAKQQIEAMKVIEAVCLKKSCKLTVVDVSTAKKVENKVTKQTFSYEGYERITITMLGLYQIENALVALEAVKQLIQLGFSVNDEQLFQGFYEAQWLGRFSIIAKNPMFIADGAHNRAGAQKLAETIQFYFTNKKIIYIMGILRDKEYEKIIEATAPYASDIITVTTPNTERSMQAYELAKEVSRYHDRVTVADSVCEAVELAYLLSDKETVVIAFGSLSYLGELITVVQNKDTMRRDVHGKQK